METVILSKMRNLLGGAAVTKHPIRTPLDLIELSDKGIDKRALLRLADHLGVPVSQMAEWLPVTERTIQRYSAKQRFSRVVSEHILQIAKVAAKGEDVFGGKEKFLEWMKQPIPALANRTPRSLLTYRYGTELVLIELGRIEHGIHS